MVDVPDAAFEVLELGDVGVFFGEGFFGILVVLELDFFEVCLVEGELLSLVCGKGELVEKEGVEKGIRGKGEGDR